MAKLSKGTATLLSVLSGGMPRNPVYLQRQALVSLLYPVITDVEALALSGKISAGGALKTPYIETMSFSAGILPGGAITGIPVVEIDIGTESLQFSASILPGGKVKTVRKDYETPDTEALSFGVGILPGGVVKTVAVRHDTSTHDTENLGFSAGILPGGYVGV